MTKIFVKIPEISDKSYEVELDFEQNPSQLIEEFQQQILDKDEDYEIKFNNQPLKLTIPWNQQLVKKGSQVDIFTKLTSIMLVCIVKKKSSITQIKKKTTVLELQEMANKIFSINDQVVLYKKGEILNLTKSVFEQVKDGSEIEVRIQTQGGDQIFL